MTTTSTVTETAEEQPRQQPFVLVTDEDADPGEPCECDHGCIFPSISNGDEWTPLQQECRRVTQDYNLHTPTSKSPGELLAWNLEFWHSDGRADVVQRDVDGCIPRFARGMAVGDGCKPSSSLVKLCRVWIAAYRVTWQMQTESPLSPQEFQEWLDETSTDPGLYLWMNNNLEHRACRCMELAAKAAANNTLCGCCGKITDGTKQCSQCRDTMYCNRDCQKKAWKEHKKVCGRTPTT